MIEGFTDFVSIALSACSDGIIQTLADHETMLPLGAIPTAAAVEAEVSRNFMAQRFYARLRQPPTPSSSEPRLAGTSVFWRPPGGRGLDREKKRDSFAGIPAGRDIGH